jgi:predicted ATP-grasp superfamily ATP-dependent carboligase
VRVFVCEFVTGGGLAGAPLPEGLRREGDMMLRALVKDLAELPAIEVVTTRDDRLSDPGLPAELRWIGDGGDPWTAWRHHMSDVDIVWPIAPETGGILERLSALVLDCGRRLVGSSPAAVRLAASKLQTARHLSAHGIATVPTLALTPTPPESPPASATGWIAKPDDGAGSEDTFLLPTKADLRRWMAGRRDARRFVLQPYVEGTPTSLSLLCRDGQAVLLSCNLQDMRLAGDRLAYHGGMIAGAEDRRPQYQLLARQIAAAIPELGGYVGVDMIDSADGPVVLEINPRLTTSYVGLRRAIGANPAALALDLLTRNIDSLAGIVETPRQKVRIDADAA